MVPMGKYVVNCTGCSAEYGGVTTRCNEDEALLRTVYAQKRLKVSDHPGIWKFIEWLPVENIIDRFTGGSITYKSKGLARELGLHELYVSFNGYWPERGADLITCSFKDLEAPPTIQALKEEGRGNIIVVASAGNTARAFAHISAITGYPLVLVVPMSALGKLWLPDDASDAESIYTVSVEGDYSDAIDIGDRLASHHGFIPEGGCRNVARRDGMGTVMLEATLFMRELPAHYFQAVGSGTGGIAAWEASLRLIEDGRYGNKLPILHLSQNLPCAPIYSAVHGGTYNPICPKGMFDQVLFNRKPPYSVVGGVADALRATKGSVWGITNAEAAKAKNSFELKEGIDIMPAAGVAVAALMKAVNQGYVGADEKILLNITGGGEARLRKERATFQLLSDLNVPAKMLDVDDIVKRAIDKLRKVE